MKLLVENIAAVEHAEIAIDGISVLAGLNATGKSTISKSLVAIIQAYSDILLRVKDSQRRSIDQIIDDFLVGISESGYFETQRNDNLIDALLNKELCLPESYSRFLQAFIPYTSYYGELPKASKDTDYLYAKFRAQVQKAITRPAEDYIKFLVEGSIRRSFDNQINTLGRNTTGKIELQNDNGASICHAIFRENKILDCSLHTIKEAAPIYLEPKHILDHLETSAEHRRFWVMRNRPPSWAISICINRAAKAIKPLRIRKKKSAL